MNQLASIKSFNTYGVPRSVVLHAITSYKHISDMGNCIDDYYMLYCSPEYFATNQHAGIYYRDDKQYIIIYETGLTRWFALNAKNQLVLSFRSAQPEYDLPAYVFVSLS